MSNLFPRTAFALLAATTAFGFAACGGDDSDDAAQTPAPPAETTPSTPAETADDTATTQSGDHPEWAQVPTETGDSIATVKAGDVEVDVRQVGTTKSPKKGNFVDPDTNKPIIDEGDEIVILNYVITNTGEPIDLGSSRVSVSARYEDWPYMQGMDSITDRDLYEKMKVNNDSLAPGGMSDKGIYPFGTDQTYSVGDNFKYQANSPIEFEVTITPVDAEGELLHDQRIKGEGSGTIK